LKIAVEVYSQKDRSLDFDLLKKTATTFSSGAMASLFPLPAAALPMLDSVSELIASLYDNSRKATLVDAEEVVLNWSTQPLRADIGLYDQEVPVEITVEMSESRFVSGRLTDGKFKVKPDESIFRNASLALAPGKYVSIIELIATSSDADLKSTRPLLDAVIGGGTYGKDPANKKEDNVATLCGNLYDALNRYLSKYDARAMFWVFINRYGELLNREACLGSRQQALVEVGLD
jgi:hypothetical protein